MTTAVLLRSVAAGLSYVLQSMLSFNRFFRRHKPSLRWTEVSVCILFKSLNPTKCNLANLRLLIVSCSAWICSLLFSVWHPLLSPEAPGQVSRTSRSFFSLCLHSPSSKQKLSRPSKKAIFSFIPLHKVSHLSLSTCTHELKLGSMCCSAPLCCFCHQPWFGYCWSQPAASWVPSGNSAITFWLKLMF